MEAMEELAELADTTLQGTALLADDDPSADDDRPSRRGSSFLTVVAIGNVVRIVSYTPPAVPIACNAMQLSVSDPCALNCWGFDGVCRARLSNLCRARGNRRCSMASSDIPCS
jgi:hypothetical protein